MRVLQNGTQITNLKTGSLIILEVLMFQVELCREMLLTKIHIFTKHPFRQLILITLLYALDKTNDWISLNFGKSNQENLFPISDSGAALIYFGNGGVQAFNGKTLVGSGWDVPNDEKLHIILTAYIKDYDPEYKFDYDPVRYSTFANGIPLKIDNTLNGYVYNNSGGFGHNYISLYSYNSVSTNTSLFDNLKIYKVANTTSISNWTNDADMLPMTPAKTTHAVNLNGASININGVDFIGTGTNFAVYPNGSSILKSNGWELIGSDGAIAFHNGQNVSNIVSDIGSRTLMEYFAFNGNALGLKLSDLSPFSTNVISFYSYGWEAAGRTVYFSSSSGGDILEVDQDTYGIGSGIIVRYSYVADKNGKCTFVISKTGGAAWHLSGFYSEEIAAPAAQISIPKKLDFGEVLVDNPATLQLEVENIGAGEINGSIAGNSNPFSLATSYSATAATSDLIIVTFTPTTESDFSQTISLTGTGGNAQVKLTGTGVPEPLSAFCFLLSAFCIFFVRKNNK